MANVYVTGASHGIGTYTDIATIKYRPNGDQVWVARYHGPHADSLDAAYAVAVDGLGNVYVTGSSYWQWQTGGLGELVTIKYDALGNQLWVARYRGHPTGSLGGAGIGIALDRWGNVYIAGSVLGMSGTPDYATVKYNPNGNQVWARQYHSGSFWEDTAYSISVDQEGNVYVTGMARESNDNANVVTIKYASGGNLLWLARYDGPGGCTYLGCSNGDAGYHVAVDEKDNVYVAGNSFQYFADYVVIKYCQQTGDVTGDGMVDDEDLAAVWLAFGEVGSQVEDINVDGIVDDADLAIVIFHFGEGYD